MNDFIFDSFYEKLENAVKDTAGLELVNLQLTPNTDYEDDCLTIGVRTHDGRYNWRKIVRTTAKMIVDGFGLQFSPSEVDRVRHSKTNSYLFEAPRG